MRYTFLLYSDPADFAHMTQDDRAPMKQVYGAYIGALKEADAFARALGTWLRTGVPRNPDAWSMTAARNRTTDALRRQTRFPKTDRIPDMPFPATATEHAFPTIAAP